MKKASTASFSVSSNRLRKDSLMTSLLSQYSESGAARQNQDNLRLSMRGSNHLVYEVGQSILADYTKKLNPEPKKGKKQLRRNTTMMFLFNII